jgi:DNA-binding transcriptional ArsR family regulator
MAKALAHPLRTQVLTLLNDRVASPNELARDLGEPLGNVSYHVKALLELGCIELVDTAQRRGAIEHYYRALTSARLDGSAFKRLPPSVRSQLSGTIVEAAIADASRALKAGTFDARSDRHASFDRLVLDEQGFAALTREVAALTERAEALQAESAERLQSGGARIDAALALFAYESAGQG